MSYRQPGPLALLPRGRGRPGRWLVDAAHLDGRQRRLSRNAVEGRAGDRDRAAALRQVRGRRQRKERLGERGKRERRWRKLDRSRSAMLPAMFSWQLPPWVSLPEFWMPTFPWIRYMPEGWAS